MKPIKVLHMYADILDLYGDSGNMEILSYRCQMRQIPFVCDHYRLNDPVPNFSDYDLIYLGGGADMEQRMLSSDLLRCKDGLKKAHADGVFFLMICGGYQLMGKFYRDADGNELPGLGLFNYYTIAPHSRRKRCIGNIIIRTQLTGEPLEVVLRHIIESRYLRPRRRIYQTQNIYALLEKQAQLENEVKAIAQGNKQKAHRKRKAAD